MSRSPKSIRARRRLAMRSMWRKSRRRLRRLIDDKTAVIMRGFEDFFADKNRTQYSTDRTRGSAGLLLMAIPPDLLKKRWTVFAEIRENNGIRRGRIESNRDHDLYKVDVAGTNLLLRAPKRPLQTKVRLPDMEVEQFEISKYDTTSDTVTLTADGAKKAYRLCGVRDDIFLFMDSGEIFIVDNMESPTMDGPVVDASKHPVFINGKPLRRGKPIPISHGDEIVVGLSVGVVRLPKKSAVHEMSGMSHFQQLWWPDKIAKAQKWSELLAILDEIGKYGAPSLKEEVKGVIDGRLSLLTLSEMWGVRKKVEELMDNDTARIGSEIDRFDVVLKKQLMHRTVKELNFLKARFILDMKRLVQTAEDINEIIEFLKNSNAASMSGYKVSKIITTLKNANENGGNGIRDIPRPIRQTVSDMVEARELRLVAELIKRGERPEIKKAPDDMIDEYQRLDETYEGIINQAYATGLRSAPESVHQVLERGKTLMLVTERNGLRDKVREFMTNLISAAERFFPDDMNFETVVAGGKKVKVKINPFTGELILEDNLEGRYRLAKNLLNSRAGRPVHGIPSSNEVTRIVFLMRNYVRFNSEAIIDYQSAQRILRSIIDKKANAARELFENATPEDKALLLETYFGGSRHRDMESPDHAFQAARFFGEIGIYRETAVTLTFDKGRSEAVLSLGDLCSGHRPERNSFFALHTHPEQYLNQNQRIMGRGKTTITWSEIRSINSDDGPILFSPEDVEMITYDAKRYVGEGYDRRFGPTILFDPAKRIYRNWVLQPHGGSEIRIHLSSSSGEIKKIEIFYALVKPHDNQQNGTGYQIQRDGLETTIGLSLEIPVKSRQISMEQLRELIP